MRNFFAFIVVLCVASVFADDKKLETLPKTAKFADGTEVAIPYPDATWKQEPSGYLLLRGDEIMSTDEESLEKDDIFLTKIERFTNPDGRVFLFMRDCTPAFEPLIFIWAVVDAEKAEAKQMCVAVRNEDGTVQAVNEPFTMAVGSAESDKGVCARWVVEQDGKIVAERVFPR